MDNKIFSEIIEENDIKKLKEKALNLIDFYSNGMNSFYFESVLYKFIFEHIDFTTEFIKSENPKVSIIISVKNGYNMTAALLHSIKKHTKGIEYEVIIADDNSTDETKNIEKNFQNVIRVVNNTGHNGFIYNVNNAIEHAKGEYIFSMNNDMLTFPNYLSELLEVIENDKTIGIAGSKTINMFGNIQECGVLMNKNGIHKYLCQGQSIDYNDELNYIDCDYCSGCAILFRRDIWKNAGKFDINLAPAYFDDSDFSFNLKFNLGLKTVAVPRSKLIHYISMSYSASKEKSETIQKNRNYFINKWKKYLQG